jgi:hypothetical protein
MSRNQNNWITVILLWELQQAQRVVGAANHRPFCKSKLILEMLHHMTTQVLSGKFNIYKSKLNHHILSVVFTLINFVYGRNTIIFLQKLFSAYRQRKIARKGLKEDNKNKTLPLETNTGRLRDVRSDFKKNSLQIQKQKSKINP